MCIPFAMMNPKVGKLTDVEHDWIGHVDGADIPSYIDYGLLLIFGGIPWQVSSQQFTITIKIIQLTSRNSKDCQKHL